MSYVSYGNKIANELPKPKVNKEVEQVALKILKEVEAMYMSQGWHFVEGHSHSQIEGWELVSKDQIKDVCQGTRLSREESGFLLKISGLTGSVRGLAFNAQYNSMLAAAAQGNKLNIYYIYRTVRDSASTYEFVDTSEEVKDAKMTFLEWHPQFPAILASICDLGITTIWDTRQRKPGIRISQNAYCCEVHWQPNNVVGLATASNGNPLSDPVKIRDLNRPLEATHTFGPRKGVNSLSWSAADGLILTTDTDGGVKCWKLNAKSADPCGTYTTVACSEARWCESEGAFAVSSSGGVGLCKVLKN